MYLYNHSIVVIFIGCAYQFLCEDFDPKTINLNELVRLKNTYKEFLGLTIQHNVDYMFNDGKGLVCPQPYDRYKKYGTLYYGDVKVVGKTLAEVVDSCIESKSNLIVCYATFLNVIESVGLTYIYRYAAYAYEMESRKINIDAQNDQFAELSKRIIKVFRKEYLYEEETVDYTRQVTLYNKSHVSKYPNKLESSYMKRLATCMDRSKFSLVFVADLGEWDCSENTSDSVFNERFAITHNRMLELFPKTDDDSSTNSLPEEFPDIIPSSSEEDGYDNFVRTHNLDIFVPGHALLEEISDEDEKPDDFFD